VRPVTCLGRVALAAATAAVLAVTVLAAPATAGAVVLAGGGLPAVASPDAPSVGVTLQPRSEGRIRLRFETVLRCSGAVTPVARAVTVAWDGASVAADGVARAPFAQTRVRYAWTVRARVAGAAAAGAVQIAAQRDGRACRGAGPRTFVAHTVPVAAGAAARPAAGAVLYGGGRRLVAGRRPGSAVLRVDPDGARVTARWSVAARCSHGPAHRFTNLTPPTRIGDDGRFARRESFRVRYADGVVRYRVRFGGRFTGSAARGELRLRATIRGRSGALLARCDTRARGWSAAAGGEPPAQPAEPVTPPPSTDGDAAPPSPSPDPQFRPESVPGSWSLDFTSDPGEYLGQGQTWHHGSAYGEQLDMDVWAPGDIIQFETRTRDGDANWGGNWGSGDGTALHVGTYQTPANGTGATQAYGGDYRGCGNFTGWFTISALAYDPNGALRTLRVTFEAHCEGLPEAIRGTFAFDAA